MNGTVADGSVVEVIMSGTSISVNVDGVQKIAPQTVTEFATVTTHGLLGTVDNLALRWGRVEFV